MMNLSSKKYLFGYDLLCIILLAIMGYVTTNGVEHYMDIIPWDEGNYLSNGLLLWQKYIRNWGPMYSVWYKILSYYTENRVALYYFNFKVLTILSAMLIYLFLVRHYTSRIAAFFFATLWLFHTYNFTVWPKVSHFCMVTILIAGIYASYHTSKTIKTIAFSAAFLICSYARLEYFLAFLFSIPIIGYLVYKTSNRFNRWQLLHLLALLFLFAGCYKLYRTPFTNGEISRGGTAFVQHFAYNYAIWTNQKILFWYDWHPLVDKHFKPPYTLKELLIGDAPIFIRHLLFNFALFIKKITFIVIQFLVPFTFYSKKIFFVLLSFLSILIIAIRSRMNTAIFMATLHKNRLILLLLILASIPTIAACIYIHPREHYLVSLIPAICLIVGLFFSNNKVKNQVIYPILFAIIIIIIAPKSKDFIYFDLFGTNKELMNIRTINYLEQQFPEDSILLFDVDGILPLYMNQNFKPFDYRPILLDNTLLLSNLFKQRQILPDIIYVTPTMQQTQLIQKDTAFIQLLKAPQNYNFNKVTIGKLESYLLIKQSLR